MPTAIILFGLVHRSLRHTIQGIRTNLVAPLLAFGDVHIYYHSWNCGRLDNPRTGEVGTTVDPAVTAELLPDAVGVIEKCDLDRLIYWSSAPGRNPMRTICSSEHAASATFWNARRALESAKRAWGVFESRKRCRYDRVVVTRPDLLFLSPLELPDELKQPRSTQARWVQDTIWIPDFHEWGGVNDRFALCTEETARVWCNRTEFFDGWALRPETDSTEWVLLQWLKRNLTKIAFIGFRFQRVRANGLVAEYDKALDSKADRTQRMRPKLQREAAGEGSMSHRFLILARSPNQAAENLANVLGRHGRTEVVAVKTLTAEEEGDHISRGFSGLNHLGGHVAWDLAFHRLDADPPAEGEKIWLIEDDVAGNPYAFSSLIEATPANVDLAALDVLSKASDPGWPHWGHATDYFPGPWKGFLPLCCLSPALVREIQNFRRLHGRYIFHEVLFPSLAKSLGSNLLDWRSMAHLRLLLGRFRYSPEVAGNYHGICHPVNDPYWHDVACR